MAEALAQVMTLLVAVTKPLRECRRIKPHNLLPCFSHTRAFDKLFSCFLGFGWRAQSNNLKRVWIFHYNCTHRPQIDLLLFSGKKKKREKIKILVLKKQGLVVFFPDFQEEFPMTVSQKKWAFWTWCSESFAGLPSASPGFSSFCEMETEVLFWQGGANLRSWSSFAYNQCLQSHSLAVGHSHLVSL